MAPRTIDTTTGEVQVPVTRDSALAGYGALIMAIPEAEASDGSEMIADILMATTWEQLNEDSKLPSFDDLAPMTFRVNDITRAPSDIAGGLGWYLLVDCHTAERGDFKVQTSSGVPMAKLIKLYFMGAFPASVSISRAEKATRNGMHPLNLTVNAVSNQ